MIEAFIHSGFLPALVSFLGVAVLVPIAIRLAPKLNLLDAPDVEGGRKRHEGRVPLIGGLVIFPVFIITALAFGFSFAAYWPLYISIVFLLVTGALDDTFALKAWYKFGVQSLVAVTVVFGGAHIRELGDLFGSGGFDLGFMSWIFSLAAVVLLINAVNLMDGLDGLAAGYVCVALSWIAFACWTGGDSETLRFVMVIIGAILGFLVYNMRHVFRSRAALFLGDAGSLCLGLALAWFAISSAKDVGISPLEPMAVAWILALPIYDTCAQFYRRVRLGRHPFSPDRGHFHHHFIHAGISDGRSVAMILGIAAAFGAVGVFGVSIEGLQPFLTVLWIVLLLAHMVISDKPERYTKLFSRFLS